MLGPFLLRLRASKRYLYFLFIYLFFLNRLHCPLGKVRDHLHTVSETNYKKNLDLLILFKNLKNGREFGE